MSSSPRAPLSRPGLRVGALVATLGAALASPALAAAQSPPSTADVAAARTHFERGLALFEQHDPDAALAEFLRAYELSRRPSVLFNLSATYQALHRYPEAIDSLHEYLRAADPAHARQRAEAETALQQLEALVARVRIAVTPADASIALDGRELVAGTTELVVGPGQHVLSAAREGYEPARLELVVASGDARSVALELRPHPTTVAVASAPESAAAVPPVVPVPRSVSSALRIVGAPARASAAVDGRAYSTAASLTLAPGHHRIVVSAPGRRPWSGDVVFSGDESRVLRVELPAVASALPPGYFWSAAIATGVLAAGAITAGLLTMQTNADFQSRTSEDPEVDAIASRGRAFAITADVLTASALAVGALGIYLLTRTEFVPRVGRAEFVAVALPGQGSVSARLRF